MSLRPELATLTGQETAPGFIDRIRHFAGRAALCLAMGAGAFVATEAVASPDTAAGAQAIVGMPFTGQWGYNQLVNPDSNGSYSDATSSHPSVHHRYYGDWATDVYAAAGTPVKLHVSSPDGAVSFSYNRSNDTCSSVGANVAGHGIVLNVLVNGATVGSVDYEHLDSIASGPYANGMTIGTVTSESLSSSCYSARHAHVELKNGAAGYSCWVDKGKPGTAVSENGAIGVLNSGNTGPQQKCGAVPSSTSHEGSTLQMITAGDSSVFATNQIQAGGWTQEAVTGTARAITAGGSIQMMIDGSSAVWAKSSIGVGGWTQETAGGTAASIATGSGVQMLIDGNSAVWARPAAPSRGDWTQETATGTASAIAAAGNIQMMIDGCAAVWAKDGIGAGGWTRETDCGTAKAIAVSDTGVQMLIDATDAVRAKNAIGFGGWTQETEGGTAQAIAIGGNTQMLLNACNAVYALGSISAGGWTRETDCGTATKIAAGSGGVQMLIDGNSAVWAKDGIGAGGWTQETAAGTATAIAAG